jgi:hypothetical protein
MPSIQDSGPGRRTRGSAVAGGVAPTPQAAGEAEIARATAGARRTPQRRARRRRGTPKMRSPLRASCVFSPSAAPPMTRSSRSAARRASRPTSPWVRSPVATSRARTGRRRALEVRLLMSWPTVSPAMAPKRGFRRRGRRVGNDGDELDLPVEGTSPDLDVVDPDRPGKWELREGRRAVDLGGEGGIGPLASGVAQHQALETGVAAAHEDQGGGSQRPQPGVAGAREDVLRTEKDVRARRWLRHRRRL